MIKNPYDDIYRFPGGYQKPPEGNPPDCPPPEPPPCPPKPDHFLPSYERETSKNVDIYDRFGNLRYVVELASQLQSPGERGYKVTVAQMLPNGLEPFMQIPPDDEWQTNYAIAITDFNTCVKKYKSLIDAEMRDFRDIDVYS